METDQWFQLRPGAQYLIVNVPTAFGIPSSALPGVGDFTGNGEVTSGGGDRCLELPRRMARNWQSVNECFSVGVFVHGIGFAGVTPALRDRSAIPDRRSQASILSFNSNEYEFARPLANFPNKALQSLLVVRPRDGYHFAIILEYVVHLE